MAVESANVVGYIDQTVDTDSTAANVGVCLGVVGNPSASFTITGNAFGTELNDWDQFYAFDADNWDLTCYSYQGAADGWSVTYADTEIAPEVVESLTIAPGTSLYYLGSQEKFSLVGEVAASGTQSIEFDPDESYAFDLVNPFPVATTLADLETFVNDWDQVYIFDPANWDLNCYTYQGSADGWAVNYADTEKSPEIIKDSSTVILEAGQGGTYMPTAKTTWEKTLNY